MKTISKSRSLLIAQRAGRLVASALLLAVLTGCSKTDEPTQDGPVIQSRTEDLSWGAVEFKVEIRPSPVRLDRDVELSMRLTVPSEIDIDFPTLDGRLTGFTVNGIIPGEPVTANGKTTRTQRVLLSPTVAEEHRIAPLAVQYRRLGKPAWYPTAAIVFETVDPAPDSVARDVRGNLQPRWVPPSAWTIVGLGLGLPVLVGLLAVLAWWGFKHLHRAQQLRRMSPRERALLELTELLAKDLISREMFSDFYVELTMVVRRYIERMHGIRAPEQTTEEFLQAVSRDSRFPAEILERLRDFLQAADLVKFAAHRPDDSGVNTAVETARQYVVQDEKRATTQTGKEGS